MLNVLNTHSIIIIIIALTTIIIMGWQKTLEDDRLFS